MKQISIFPFIIVLVTLLTSCITMHYGTYKIGLQEVERPKDAMERYGESKITNFEEDGIIKYSFEDDKIKIIWLPTSSQLNFNLENKTDHSIKIIWDETAYVDENGISKRVMHAGVKYTDRNLSQPPSVIVKLGSINDMVLPADNVYFQQGDGFTTVSGWKEKPLFPNSVVNKIELTALMESNVGKTTKVLLSLQIEDIINEYIFTFKVEDFVRE